MGMLSEFHVSAEQIETAKRSKSTFKSLPPGEGYVGQLVAFELVPGKDDPQDLNQASVKFTFRVKVAPNAEAFVGKNHYVRQSLKEGKDGTSIGWQILQRLYKEYTRESISIDSIEDMETILQCIKDKAEQQTANHVLKVGPPSANINPQTGEPYDGFTTIGKLTVI